LIGSEVALIFLIVLLAIPMIYFTESVIIPSMLSVIALMVLSYEGYIYPFIWVYMIMIVAMLFGLGVVYPMLQGGGD